VLPVLLLSREDFIDCRFHVLVLSSLYGVCLMLSADSFLTLFVGLELMSLPVYVLVVLAYRGPRSAEAALKYLVLGGAASATLLMGAALVYGAAGSLSTAALAAALGSQDTMAIAGAMLVIAAFFLNGSPKYPQGFRQSEGDQFVSACRRRLDNWNHQALTSLRNALATL